MLEQVLGTLANSTSDEKKLLAEHKAKLKAKQVKLLQAHYADAIRDDLLQTELDCICASLEAITGPISDICDV